MIEKGFSGAEHKGRILPMIKQDKQSWSKGRADAMRGAQYGPPRATHQEATGIALTGLVTP